MGPAFYRKIAAPLVEVQPCSLGSLADAAHAVLDEAHEPQYDLDLALLAMKARHAEEAQAFVLAHHTRCLEILENSELRLERQTELLLARVAEWAAACTSSCRPSVIQYVELQARAFVELIFRQELAKVEARLQASDAKVHVPPGLTLFVRCACALILFLAVILIDHEVLERVFAIFVAVLCGASLVWEDVIVRCMKTVFGEKSLQLRNPTQMITDLWRTY